MREHGAWHDRGRIGGGPDAAAESGPYRAAPPDSTAGANPPAPADPAGTEFFVDPNAPAARQAAEWAAKGRVDDAASVRKIADAPIAFWAGAELGATREYLRRAGAAGRRPLLVAYNIPGRDCGSYSAGGAADAGGYRAWVAALAGALGGGPATVILEPDAVPQAVNGCAGAARYELLADAVRGLKAAGSVHVYVDAGGPGFVTDLGALAGALRSSGIGPADGFSVNVSNFHSTAEAVSYGKQLSSRLGGEHFVVDTSRNGRGAAGGDVNGGPGWCNPPGRALGRPPTTQTGEPLVDAFLWIKRPGESDGACRAGEPRAGTWWPDYALGLARRAA